MCVGGGGGEVGGGGREGGSNLCLGFLPCALCRSDQLFAVTKRREIAVLSNTVVLLRILNLVWRPHFHSTKH